MPGQTRDFVRSTFLNLNTHEVLQSKPSVLLGVSPEAEQVLQRMSIHTVFDLSLSKLFNTAEYITDSTSYPQNLLTRYGRVPADAVDDAFADARPKDLVDNGTGSLRGVSEDLEKDLAEIMGVASIREMSLWAPYVAAKRLVMEALEPSKADEADREAPIDLVPTTGDYPTDKVYYQVVTFIDAPDGQSQEITGPIDLSNPLKTGFSKPTTGAILTFSQAWFPQAVALGQLLYSLPLAPGESTKIAVIDFTRRNTGSAMEDISQTERLSNSMVQSRAISEIANSVARETQRGRSKVSAESESEEYGHASGTFIGIYGEGGSSAYARNEAETKVTSTSKGKRELSASTQQNIRDSTQQNAFSARNKRAAVVTEASLEEREQITTRTVTNYNHMHAMSIQYYEVVQMYQTQVRTEKCERCIFIPMKVFKFSDEITMRFKDILYQTALNARVRELLIYLTGSVTAELSLTPGYKFVEED